MFLEVVFHFFDVKNSVVLLDLGMELGDVLAIDIGHKQMLVVLGSLFVPVFVSDVGLGLSLNNSGAILGVWLAIILV